MKCQLLLIVLTLWLGASTAPFPTTDEHEDPISEGANYGSEYLDTYEDFVNIKFVRAANHTDVFLEDRSSGKAATSSAYQKMDGIGGVIRLKRHITWDDLSQYTRSNSPKNVDEFHCGTEEDMDPVFEAVPSLKSAAFSTERNMREGGKVYYFCYVISSKNMSQILPDGTNEQGDTCPDTGYGEMVETNVRKYAVDTFKYARRTIGNGGKIYICLMVFEPLPIYPLPPLITTTKSSVPKWYPDYLAHMRYSPFGYGLLPPFYFQSLEQYQNL